MSENFDVIVIFPIYGQFGAIGKTDSGQINCKTADFLQKNADISKIKMALVLQGIFSETTYVCTYLPNFKFLA